MSQSPPLANLLIERTLNPSWVLVNKGLITIHYLMCYGNEVCNYTRSDSKIYKSIVTKVHLVPRLHQQQLPAEQLPGQDWGAG